jgi:hypothetical protein
MPTLPQDKKKYVFSFLEKSAAWGIQGLLTYPQTYHMNYSEKMSDMVRANI